MTGETNRETPILEFRHVSLDFGGPPVLDDVGFELLPGQMIVITGTSGSGKTVLLHTAIGFFQPDSGEVLVEGRHIERLGETELLSIRGALMGLVFQEDAVFSSLTVFENTAFRLVEHGWKEKDVEKAVLEILRFVGLENDADKLPEELSIGMRHRLEIARALAGWPPIMFIDEPTSGLDPINARRIMDLVLRARDVHGISSLYVTKELYEIPYLARHHAEEDENGVVTIREGPPPGAPPTRVFLLHDGALTFTGSVEEFEASSLPPVLEMTHPDLHRRG
jgi:phospholipid/cholesterol/gamma-HCH transport system ATP-binding protein